MIIPTLQAGGLAYFKLTNGGLLPVKVTRIWAERPLRRPFQMLPSSETRVSFVPTITRWGYTKGEAQEASTLWVIPREAVSIRRLGYLIRTYHIKIGEVSS